MGFFDALSGVAKVLGGLGGLFGGDDAPSPGESLISHAMGARQAAKMTGFNPLTLLGVSPAPWGASTPPLASVDVLTSGLKDVADVASGRLARDDAAKKLQLDLAKLELEAAKANLSAFRNPSAVRSIGGGVGAATLGGKPMVQPTSAAVPSTAPLTFGPVPFGNDTAAEGVTGYTVLGYDINPDPRNSNAEVMEQRGGEVAAEVGGLLNTLADVNYTFGPAVKRWQDRFETALPFSKGVRALTETARRYQEARDDYDPNDDKLPQWGAGVASPEYPSFFNRALR